MTANPVRDEIDKIFGDAYNKAFLSQRSRSIQREPDWERWLNDDGSPDSWSYELEDVVRATRESVILLADHYLRESERLGIELRNERHERERLADRIAALQETTETQLGA